MAVPGIETGTPASLVKFSTTELNPGQDPSIPKHHIHSITKF